MVVPRVRGGLRHFNQLHASLFTVLPLRASPFSFLGFWRFRVLRRFLRRDGHFLLSPCAALPQQSSPVSAIPGYASSPPATGPDGLCAQRYEMRCLGSVRRRTEVAPQDVQYSTNSFVLCFVSAV